MLVVGVFFLAPLAAMFEFSTRGNAINAPRTLEGWTLIGQTPGLVKGIIVSLELAVITPVAMLVHSVEGPLAGSKFMMYYTPKGEKTGVSVIGDFQSKMIPAAELQKTVLASLESAFNDDSTAIRKMAAKK